MSKFLILGDAPNFGDSERSLKDTYGRYVWHLLYTAKAPIHDIAIEFLWDNPYRVGTYQDSLNGIIKKHKPKVILTLGSAVMKELSIEGSVMKNRGSVYDRHGTWVVPTYHPKELKKPDRMFAEEPIEKGYCCFADIKRAVSIYKNGWKIPEEHFIIEPTFKQVEKFHAFVMKDNPLLGCDLEGTGLSIENSRVTMHGFAWDENHAICIPEVYERDIPYWTPEEAVKVRGFLNDIYSKGRCMFQNGVGYDVPLLRRRGFHMNLNSFELDTMVYHHLLDPESAHNIGFISSMYGKTSFWKNAFVTYSAIEDRETMLQVMKYNCRDCVALHQIKNGMDRDMRERLAEDFELWKELPNLLEKEMKLSRISIKMFERGVLLDKKKLYEWRKYLDGEFERLSGELRNNFNLPPQFNLNSGAHKLFWVYGEVPKNLNKEEIEKELSKYEEKAYNYQYECQVCHRKVTKKFFSGEKVPEIRQQRCPSCKVEQTVKRTSKERTQVKGPSKDTNKYRDLLERRVLLDLEPLYKLHRYDPPKTKKDNLAIDKSAMVRYCIAIDKRVAEIEKMKRPFEKHKVEKKNLQKTRSALTALQEYGKIEKLRSSFYDYPTWRDGRVRAQILVTGTATGRWSMKKPNLMQLPARGAGALGRTPFRAPKGSKLLSVD